MEKQRYYLSTKRRIERFKRFMDARFPAHHAHGVPWFECIDTSKLDVRNTTLCIFSQLADTEYFGHALSVLNIPDSNLNLRHIGVMPYCRSDRAVQHGRHLKEAARLNAAFKELIERLQRENKSETRTFAEQVVQSAATRAR